MEEKKFVGLDGLKHFWTKIEAKVIKIIKDEIAQIIANAPEDLDTLKEIADWISTHEDSASAMNTAILANTEAISGKADKSHTHTKSQITDFPTSLKNPNALTINEKTYDGSTAVNAGVQTVANGGTGVTSQADINKAFIGDLEVGDSDVTDSTEFVSSYASDNGFSDTNAINKPYKRKFSKVWNYIKGKADSIYAASSHTHTKSQITDFPTSLPANGGTATKATQDGSGNVITSTYVKKSGDTLTGPIVMKANQYTLETAQLDMKNSDIKGANAIWFDDHAEVGEGLKFPRSSGSNYDFMRLDDGKIKVAPNVTGNASAATESIVAYTSDIPTSLPANGGTASSCSGNSATATQLQTARIIKIQDSSATYTGTGASFNGSGDATIKLPSTIKANEFKIGDGQQSIAYRSKSYNGFKMHEAQTKALYIEGRESDAGDSGGLAITNDSVTVFGAGDTNGVFRVVNEDNAGNGSATAPAIFNIFKGGNVTMTGRLTAPSATIGDRPVITGTYSTSDGILNLYTN